MIRLWIRCHSVRLNPFSTALSSETAAVPSFNDMHEALGIPRTPNADDRRSLISL